MKSRLTRFTAALAALAMAFTLSGGFIQSARARTLAQGDIDALLGTTTDASLITSPIIQIANQAQQSVVGVNNYQTRGNQFGNNFGMNPRFGGEARAGTGSGTVISPWGHVLTNYHVIDGATRVTVSYNNLELDAAIAGSDESLDLAVLLVPGLDLPHVPLGDSDAIQVGEYAIVIGNPLGEQFERSVTVGVVSAVQRAVASTTRDRFGLRTEIKNQMIQIDAAISSGNSGGAMFNILGQLQGVPTLKFLDQGGSFFSTGASVDNIGMCVPINAAKPLIRQVLESYDETKVQEQAERNRNAAPTDDTTPRPRMGVSVGTLSTSFQPVALGLIPQGAYVSNVEQDSPAMAAGIKTGDIIVEADSTIITDHTQLISMLQGMNAGDTVRIKVYRVAGLPAALEDTQLFNSLGEGEYLDFTVELRVM